MRTKRGGRERAALQLLLVGVIFWGIGLPSAEAETNPFKEQNQELNIGVPDMPRKTSLQFPEKGERAVDLGILKLHPFYIQGVQFDDNIKLEKTDEKEDVIFTERPGIVTEMKLGDHRVEMGYGMEILNFAKNDEENSVGHMAHGLLELNFDELAVVAQDSVDIATSRLYSETSTRDRILINTAEVAARYDRPNWAGEMGYKHNTIDHRHAPLEVNDYEEDVLAVLAGYKILPKTLMLAEFDWGVVYYDSNEASANQTYWQLFGGVQGDPSEKFSLQAKLGVQGRNVGKTDGAVGRGTDYDGLVANVDMIYELTDDDVVRGGYVRSIKTSTFGENSWYRQDRLFLSYRKRIINEKWYFMSQASWQMNAYPEGSTVSGETRRRDDHFWQASLGLQYRIQDWLWTGLRYNFRHRNSDFDTFDYSNNRLTFDVTFAY